LLLDDRSKKGRRNPSGNDADAHRYIDAGLLFVAVGSDAGLLARSGRELAGRFKG
jgi:4-hydroxy-2-oxoheptanedioate aldolase